jgi:hypothetical protein
LGWLGDYEEPAQCQLNEGAALRSGINRPPKLVREAFNAKFKPTDASGRGQFRKSCSVNTT